MTVYGFGQTLKPAERSIVTRPGQFYGMCTNYPYRRGLHQDHLPDGGTVGGTNKVYAVVEVTGVGRAVAPMKNRQTLSAVLLTMLIVGLAA